MLQKLQEGVALFARHLKPKDAPKKKGLNPASFSPMRRRMLKSIGASGALLVLTACNSPADKLYARRKVTLQADESVMIESSLPRQEVAENERDQFGYDRMRDDFMKMVKKDYPYPDWSLTIVRGGTFNTSRVYGFSLVARKNGSQQQKGEAGKR